jgi:adenosylcobinamide-GDP ribazoletransferase
VGGAALVNPFLGATSFLTRLPTGTHARDPAELGRAAPWFPLVGALLGVLLAGVYAVGLLVWPRELAATVALAAGLALTGAFHEDGLADSADAFGAGDRHEALRRLADPRLGTFGVGALLVSLLGRTLALATLSAEAALAVLPAAHALSRAAAVAVSAALPAASSDGLGASYARHVGGARAGAAGAAGVAVATASLGIWGPIAVLAAVPGTLLVARGARRKLGGATGDVLGAVQQLVELSILALAAGLRFLRETQPAWWP